MCKYMCKKWPKIGGNRPTALASGRCGQMFRFQGQLTRQSGIGRSGDTFLVRKSRSSNGLKTPQPSSVPPDFDRFLFTTPPHKQASRSSSAGAQMPPLLRGFAVSYCPWPLTPKRSKSDASLTRYRSQSSRRRCRRASWADSGADGCGEYSFASGRKRILCLWHGASLTPTVTFSPMQIGENVAHRGRPLRVSVA